MDLYVCSFGLFVALAGLLAVYRWQKGTLVLSLLLLLASSQAALAAPPASPIAALGTSETTLNRGQKELEETLKLDPTGDHYKGIEYSSQSVQNQPSDQAIIEAIKPELADDVEIAVSNGSVRLSGNVKSRSVAKKIVELAKKTNGVHEVAFDLGLTG